MAALSDQLLVVTIFVYLVAMIGHAVEYALGTGRIVARPAVQPARERVLVGAGGSAPVEPPVAEAATPPSGTAKPPTGRAAVAGQVAVWATVVAALVHLSVIVTRSVAAGRMPWGNMYE